MILLPHKDDIPSWILKHKACTNSKFTDDDLLDLHALVYKREQELLLEYHLKMSENPVRDEIRHTLHQQFNRLKKLRQDTIDTLLEELEPYRSLSTRTTDIVYRTEEDLVHAHTKLLIAHRVSARVVHFFLIQYRLSCRLALIEKDLQEYQALDTHDIPKLYDQIQTMKTIRETIEKWVGGASHAELASLASLHFK
jgi:hypothetical protein